VLQVKLLKDVLDAWKKEVERKPPEMSVDDAYEVLGLQRGVKNDEATVRKAYYRLAQQFHPDKNPDGRVSFFCCCLQLKVHPRP
jgi:DnaJ family protein C protein 13